MRSTGLRLPIILILIVLIPLSGWLFWRDLSTGWQLNQQESSDYLHAPGCFPPKEDDPQDPGLPPCSYAWASVAAMTTHEVRSKINASGLRTAYDIAIRDQTGMIHWYYDTWDSFYSECTVGEPVSLKYWKGQIMELDAGGNSYMPNTISRDVTDDIRLSWGWLLVSFTSLSILAGMFRFRRRYL